MLRVLFSIDTSRLQCSTRRQFHISMRSLRNTRTDKEKEESTIRRRGRSHRSKSSSRGKSHETVRPIGDVANESFAGYALEREKEEEEEEEEEEKEGSSGSSEGEIPPWRIFAREL